MIDREMLGTASARRPPLDFGSEAPYLSARALFEKIRSI